MHEGNPHGNDQRLSSLFCIIRVWTLTPLVEGAEEEGVGAVGGDGKGEVVGAEAGTADLEGVVTGVRQQSALEADGA